MLISLIRKLSCNVWHAGKDSRNFFVIEKQLSKEEMQPIKKIFLYKAIPLFFHLALHVFPDIGLVGWIEKKKLKKKSQEVSE